MFNKRSDETEIMDDLGCQGEVVSRTLRELEIINAWLGGNDVTINALNKCFERCKDFSEARPLKIADLGCGGGDLLKHMALAARKKKIPAQLTGVDANPFIIHYARHNTWQFPEVRYKQLDVLDADFIKEKYDIVNCTLFCHHFDDTSLTSLLRSLKRQTSTAIIINDIHRHWLAYHSIKWLTRWFSGSEMVKYDARISVLRAFRKHELEKIIREAGFSKFSIVWKWAFRFQVIIWI